MEENSKTETEYIKGFNEGYIIAKFMPDSADKIAQTIGSSDRSNGFKDGWKEYQSEKFRERYPDWLKSEPDTPNTALRSKEKDRGKE